jgi:hypothetical protein
MVCHAQSQSPAPKEPWRYSKSIAVDKDWAGFTERLAGALGQLKNHDFFIISEQQRNVYIQISDGGPEGLDAEAVSEQFFPELSKDGKMTLLELGWNAPTYKMEANTKPPATGSCNYYMEIDTDKFSAAELADVVARTFREAYLTPLPGDLEYRAFFDDHTRNYAIQFQDLGLKMFSEP